MHDRLTDKQSVSSCRIIKKETVVYLKAEEYLKIFLQIFIGFPSDQQVIVRSNDELSEKLSSKKNQHSIGNGNRENLDSL